MSKRPKFDELEQEFEKGVEFYLTDCEYEMRTGDITDCISIEYAGNKSGGLNEDLAQHFTGYRG